MAGEGKRLLLEAVRHGLLFMITAPINFILVDFTHGQSNTFFGTV